MIGLITEIANICNCRSWLCLISKYMYHTSHLTNYTLSHKKSTPLHVLQQITLDLSSSHVKDTLGHTSTPVFSVDSDLLR